MLTGRIYKILKDKKKKDKNNAIIINEFNTNEIKYLNTLSIIAEIRKELKSIKNKYNLASSGLQQTLEQKTNDLEKLKNSYDVLK